MEGETWCSGSRLFDNVTTACICVVTEWKWVSLKKKKKKKKKFFFFFFFFRETPTSPWVPFRAKFRPLGRLFRPSCPLAWSLKSSKAFKGLGMLRLVSDQPLLTDVMRTKIPCTASILFYWNFLIASMTSTFYFHFFDWLCLYCGPWEMWQLKFLFLF